MSLAAAPQPVAMLPPSMYREMLAGVSDGFFVGEAVRNRAGRMTDFRFVDFNAAFEKLTGLTHEAAHNRLVREAMPGVPDELIAAYARVVESGMPAHFEVQLDIRQHRWFEARAHRVGEDLFAVVFIDITERVAERDNLERDTGALRAIVDFVDQMIWSTKPDGRHDFFNSRWYEFTGVPVGSTDDDRWAKVFHPEDQPRTQARWRHSLDTGEPYEIEYRLRHRSGDYRWVLGRAHAIRDDDGKIVRWMGTCTDIHDHKLAETRLALLNEELSHRIKNIFAVIDGLVRLSVREGGDARTLGEQISQRIAALDRAQAFARPSASDAATPPPTILAMIKSLLEPYELDGRVVIQGDDAPLEPSAATALALVIHEAATNAAKYGALSSLTGSIRITGRIADGRYHISWLEGGGPNIRKPEREGFGTRLTLAAVQGQLRGTCNREWLPHGLKMEIAFPLA